MNLIFDKWGFLTIIIKRGTEDSGSEGKAEVLCVPRIAKLTTRKTTRQS
jgi:hypothetical protein